MPRKGARRVTGEGIVKTVGGSDSRRLRETSRGMDAQTPKGRVNKSEAIRLAINNHPTASTARIRGLLDRQGLQVTAADIDRVKSQTLGGGENITDQGGGRPKGEKGKR